jgi:uncharacterized protein
MKYLIGSDPPRARTMNRPSARHRLPLAAAIALAAAWPLAASAAVASFECDKARGPVEEAICDEPELAALDSKLVDVYVAATKAANVEQKNRLAAEQQGWLAERDRCAGSAERVACVREKYANRIADLQAQFGLVRSRGPFRLACSKDPGDILVAQYYETDPPSARFTYDGRGATAFVVRTGSGSRYEGPYVSYWERQGEASVVWYGRTMKCAVR